MKGDEFKIILEDINEKFDVMIEGHKLLNEKLDRQIEENRAEHKPSQLSGGEQQRVAIARALVNNPSLILADEPTGNMDRKTGKEILALFGQLNREGRSIVMVTHDPEIAGYAKEVLVLQDGQIVDKINQEGGNKC